MTITANAKVLVISKNETPSRDGKDTYYNLAIMQNGQAGNVSCTDEVYELAVEMKETEVNLTYNDEYKRIRITGIGMITPHGSDRAETKAPAK